MTLVSKLMSNPYPYYRRLRSRDPVYWNGDSWIVTRYADVVVSLRDPRLSSARFGRGGALASDPGLARDTLDEHLSRWMLYADPPTHTRLRALASRAFTPRVVERMRPFVQSVVDDLIDAVAAQGRMDVLADVADPLPAIVIAHLLGIAPADRAKFGQWSADLAAYIGNERQAGLAARAGESLARLMDYFHTLIAARRRDLQDDLLSSLIAAEAQGDRLSEAELFACCTLLLIAGHETTTNLIANGLLALLQHPDQLHRLGQTPALIASAVEELLRYDGPVHLAWRRAAEDLEIGGKQVQKGHIVVLNLAAANRDPSQFADPERLDITRQDNRHVAFGYGPHFCLGAPLARLEAQIAINTLLRRLSALQLETSALEWHDNLALRGLKALPVRFSGPPG